MIVMTEKERTLYRENRFEELWDIMTETNEGIKLFVALCEKDPSLDKWWKTFGRNVLDSVLSNPILDEIFEDMQKEHGPLYSRGTALDMVKTIFPSDR